MFLVKTGASSIILGAGHFNYYFPTRKNKLLKITKITEKHNEIKYLDEIKQIQNYRNYYSIPDKVSYIINPSDDFYNNIKQLVQTDNLTIFTGPLQCLYVDNAGDRDLLDTFIDLVNYKDFSIWYSFKSILHFSKQIMMALSYLHQHKICHLDIKPENIMVDTCKRKFKLIDFGFSSLEPFDEYLTSTKGTPGYFPLHFTNQLITEWLPEIRANDMILVNGEIPMKTNRQLVYKIDSYSFGRVLYYLKYIYIDNRMYFCCRKTNKHVVGKINNIISNLTESDVHKRMTIQDCLKKQTF